MVKKFLTKRRHGIWYVVTCHEDGRRTFKSTGTRDRLAAEDILGEGSNLREASTPTLVRFMDEILAYTGATFAHATMQLYRDSLRALLGVFGDMPIDGITARHVDRYKTTRVQRVKPITVNKELSTLRAAFNIAVRWGYLERNPFVDVKKLVVPETPPAFFAREELQRLEEGTRGHWIHDVIVLGINTGMRAGELTSLTWESIDFERRVIRLMNSSDFRTKTGRGRVIPCNARACDLLVERKLREEDYVLTMGGRQIKKNWLSSAFRKAARRVGIREELHFHSLRHTFASWLVQDGVSLYQVARLLGHSDVKTTEVYAHLQPETMHDVVARL